MTTVNELVLEVYGQDPAVKDLEFARKLLELVESAIAATPVHCAFTTHDLSTIQCHQALIMKQIQAIRLQCS